MLTVEIGGARLALRADPGTRLELDDAMETFRTGEHSPADITATVARANLDGGSARPREAPLFASKGLWRLFRTAGRGLLFELTSPALGPVPYKQARFDEDFCRGEILVHGGYADYAGVDRALRPLEYPLDELLFMNWLAHGRGCELHACGIVDGAADSPRAFVFVGHSGAGKTTAARLWAQRTRPVVLSDDRVILRRRGERLHAFGTPWHGEARLSAALDAPVAAIFLLNQAASFSLRELTRSEAVAALLTRTFVPMHDAAAVGFTLDFLGSVCAAVPVLELGFALDAGFVDELKRRFA